MPFIEEAKYQSMQEDLENALLKSNKAEREFNALNEQIQHQKEKARTTTVLLLIFLALACVIAYLLYNGTLNGKGSNDNTNLNVTAIRAKEERRVVDSLKKMNKSFRSSSALNGATIGKATGKLNSGNKGKVVYSVQIGSFSKNKYPMLSKRMIPGIYAESNGYFKYSIGLFASLNEAKALQKELRTLGFNDAFVASYRDGKRLKIHE